MKSHKDQSAKQQEAKWDLRLYVAGTTARSTLATENLQKLCDHYLRGQYRLRVIDLMKSPKLARKHQILMTPSLVRVHPGPEKTLVGTLSDPQSLLKALEMGVRPETLISLLSRAGSRIGNA